MKPFGINVLGAKGQSHFIKYLDNGYVELVNDAGSVENFFNNIPYSSQYALIQDWLDDMGIHTAISPDIEGLFFCHIIDMSKPFSERVIKAGSNFGNRGEAMVSTLEKAGNIYELRK